jgi:hypothetical protein
MKMPRRLVYPLAVLLLPGGYTPEAYLPKPDATAPTLDAPAPNPMQLKRFAQLWQGRTRGETLPDHPMGPNVRAAVPLR